MCLLYETYSGYTHLEEDVDLSDVYIEHWQARSAVGDTTENKGLDYRNMLAVCSGNEKAPEARKA